MLKREIEIQRNIIERTLMFLKDYIRKNKRGFAYSIIAGLLCIVFFIVGIIIYEKKAKSDLVKFEQIVEGYRETTVSEKDKRIIKLNSAANELNKLIESSYWGFVSENGYYVVGNLYFNVKLYKEAKLYYLKFVAVSPSSFFAPLALQQAARSSEITDDFDEAFKLYKRLESEYSKSEVAAQIYYDLGRIYQKRGDQYKAKEYFNKVITTYPRSIFSGKAKKQIFLLGLVKKK